MNRSIPRRSCVVLRLALAVTLTAAGAALALAANPPAPPTGLTAPPQPKPMPVFELTGINGTKLRSTDLRDKVAVFRFWATW